MSIEMQPPVGHGWAVLGPDGPVGYRRYLPEAGGWIYRITTPNSGLLKIGAEAPFFVPDLQAWAAAIAKATAEKHQVKVAHDPLEDLPKRQPP